MLIVLNSFSQNLVGYKSNEIVKFMSTSKSDMNRDNVSNSTFRYLKYSDKYDTQTILFFLNPDSVCKSMRIVCNNSIKTSKIKELDSEFSRTGEKTWIDRRQGKSYSVVLADGDWSFSITIESEK